MYNINCNTIIFKTQYISKTSFKLYINLHKKHGTCPNFEKKNANNLTTEKSQKKLSRLWKYSSMVES